MEHTYLDDELLPVFNQVMEAIRPEDVFGSISVLLPLREERAILQEKRDCLATVVDPNKYTRLIDAQAATDAAARLSELYKAAETKLQSGSYAEQQHAHVLVSGNVRYHLGQKIADGDISVLYRAIAVDDNVSNEVILKIARDSKANEYLKREAGVLAYFDRVHNRHTVAHIRPTLPTLLTQFVAEEKIILVLPWYHGHRSVRHIVEHFGKNLPIAHAAWIARRVAAFPITAKIAGMVHTAITPEHLLIHPVTHEPIYLGWGSSQDATRAKSLTHISKHYRHWYPPEVLQKNPPTHQSDIYMAGKTLIYLFGGDEQTNTLPAVVPDNVARIIHACVEDDPNTRFADGAELFNELTSAIRSVWGRKYQALTFDT